MRSPGLVRSAALVGTVLLAGMAGCSTAAVDPPAQDRTPPTSSSAAPAPSLFPPRPAELRLDNTNPCTLLSTAQLNTLGVQQAGPASDDGDDLHSLDCLWANHGRKPDNRWLARAIVKRGADYATTSSTGATVTEIGGFGAVQTSSPLGDPNTHCVVLVDVAQGQSLWVEYDNIQGDYPGINHTVACQQADKAAEFMIHNLSSSIR